jgi:hypothetical protein
MSQFFALLATLALLSGCILVDDFGKRWEEAKPDSCLNDIAKSLYIAEFKRELGDKRIEDVARAITLDKQHYLLMKKEPKDKGGRIYRFTMSAGKELHASHAVFQRWRLDPVMRETFTRDYPKSVAKLNRDTVTLPNLEGESEKLLTEIANKPEYWQIDDQTLYNTLKDPKCRFETRDLEGDKNFRPSQKYKSKAAPYRGPITEQNVPEGVR